MVWRRLKLERPPELAIKEQVCCNNGSMNIVYGRSVTSRIFWYKKRIKVYLMRLSNFVQYIIYVYSYITVAINLAKTYPCQLNYA